jgi:hypothetical protein
MAKASFQGGKSSPYGPLRDRSGVHLRTLFDFFIVSINISAAATSKANKTLTTARFIADPPFLNVGVFLLIRNIPQRDPLNPQV